MKILTIPDIHGKTIWKSVFDPSYDLIVFLGDYVDSFDTPDDIMVQNLKDVISIKNDHPDKVVLLWGNHEMHYLFPGTQFRCSGFRPSIVFEVSPLLIHNKSIFQFAFQYQNYLWTHAGVHRGWWEYEFKGNNEENIADQLNEAFNSKDPYINQIKNDRLFDCGWDRGGNQKVGGPLWIDRTSIWEKGINGIHQIVGHSKVDNIMTCKSKKDGSITFCDCLDSIENYNILTL